MKGKGSKVSAGASALRKFLTAPAYVTFLRGLDVERMKAVFITSDGVFAYNMTRDGLTEGELDDCAESRVEIIANRIEPDWLHDITACVAGETESNS